jgi:protein associated with RNAse G/E
VRVTFSKWSATPSQVFEAELLGRDAFGSWLAIPVGTVVSKRRVTSVTDHPAVLLVPAAGCFTVRYRRQHRYDVYVDVTTLPRLTDDALELVDLDLDVVRYRSGTVVVKDEDQFDERRLGYPQAVARQALATRSEVERLLATRTEPFDRAAEPWLDRVAG